MRPICEKNFRSKIRCLISAVHTQELVENSVKRPLLLKETIATQILLRFLLGHYVVSVEKISLESEGGGATGEVSS